MKRTVKEWIEKADRDLATARRELAVEADPNLDAACFHAQQCVEKLMKAVLVKADVVPPKTHDLQELAAMVESAHPKWSWPVADLRLLSVTSMRVRYPGH